MVLAGLFSLGGATLLLLIMLNAEDYYVRNDYESAFMVGYLLFIGLSLVMPLIMAVFSAILTTAWTSRDEKFDLLRLTPLPDRAFVRSYFFGALHRLRLLVALQVVLAFVSPMLVLVTVYWNDHPSPNYYYDDYSYIPLSVYLAVYGWMLLYNFALAGLSLIGATLGVHAGLYYHSTTHAITGGVGATCGSMLGLATVGGCLLYGGVIGLANIASNLESEILAVIIGYLCVSIACLLPVFALFSWYLKFAQRVVRRD